MKSLIWQKKKAPEYTGGLLDSKMMNLCLFKRNYLVDVVVEDRMGISIFADAMLEPRMIRPRATIIIFESFFMAVSRLRLLQCFLDL